MTTRPLPESEDIWDGDDNVVLEQGKVMAISLNTLIRRITDPATATPEEIGCFLVSVRAYATSDPATPLSSVMARLESRIRVPASVPEERATLVRSAVVSLVSRWIAEWPSDFSSPDGAELVSRTRQLLSLASTFPACAPLAGELLGKVPEPAPEEDEPEEGAAPAVMETLDSWCPATKRFGLYGSSACKEIARQLTILDVELFRRISARELLVHGRAFGRCNGKAWSVIAMIRTFNSISSWVTTEVTFPASLPDRAKAYEMFVRIAEELRGHRNFESMVAVLAGLDSPAVSRLKWTLECVKKKIRRLKQELSQLASSEHGFRAIRQTLSASSPETPCIPYLGIFLQDLTFISEGNQLSVGGLWNWVRAQHLFDVINKCLRFQEIPYPPAFLKPNPGLLQFFRELPTIDSTVLYHRSMEVEPRGASKYDLK